ncbi:hypothetical protein [Lancefieldella rimae]
MDSYTQGSHEFIEVDKNSLKDVCDRFRSVIRDTENHTQEDWRIRCNYIWTGNKESRFTLPYFLSLLLQDPGYLALAVATILPLGLAVMFAVNLFKSLELWDSANPFCVLFDAAFEFDKIGQGIAAICIILWFSAILICMCLIGVHAIQVRIQVGEDQQKTNVKIWTRILWIVFIFSQTILLGCIPHLINASKMGQAIIFLVLQIIVPLALFGWWTWLLFPIKARIKIKNKFLFILIFLSLLILIGWLIIIFNKQLFLDLLSIINFLRISYLCIISPGILFSVSNKGIESNLKYLVPVLRNKKKDTRNGGEDFSIRHRYHLVEYIVRIDVVKPRPYVRWFKLELLDIGLLIILLITVLTLAVCGEVLFIKVMGALTSTLI